MDGFRYKHGDRPLEGYTIQRAVGRGGFGEVYYATSDAGREVALKAIQGYEQIELRGVSACMNLKSPHLVNIFDVRHNDQGVPFVIMEYVAGPSLRELLDESPAGLGAQKAAFFLREIAKGLTYLHDRGIVHRDLKPGNIFYEDGYVKIGDYGLSKVMSASRHSGQTITVGTVHYMAPEIGQGKYDASIDIYALGCVLYEMLTGQTPFLGGSPGEILMKHLMAEPDLKGIEEPFATAIRKAMAKEPADRFGSAQEMVEAIFGTEHIRNSVSHFRPESLTMVADRVARTVTVGGSGSSAEANRLGGEGGPVTEPLTGEPLDHFSRKMQDLGRRMESVGGVVGKRLGRKMQRMGERFTGQAAPVGYVGPQATKPALDFDAARDPLTWNQRRLLAVMAAFLVAVGTGGLAEHYSGPFWSLLSFVLIGGAAGGIIGARYRFSSALEGEPLLGRLGYGMMGCTFAALFLLVAFVAYAVAQSAAPRRDFLFLFAVFYLMFVLAVSSGTMVFRGLVRNGRAGVRNEMGRAIYVIPLVAAANGLGLLAAGSGPHFFSGTAGPEEIFRTFLACGIVLLLMNWGKLTAPDRKNRISLRAAVVAGVLGFALGAVCGVSPIGAAGVMAGIMLVAQILSPFDPLAKFAAGVGVAGSRPIGSKPAAPAQPPQARQPAAAIRPGPRQADGLVPLPQLHNCSDRLRGGALMLACVGFVFPLAGLHRFYVGKIGTGLLWLCTLGFLHLGTIVDIICIATGSFRDKQGRRLLVWWNMNELEGLAPPMPRFAAAPIGTPAPARPSRRFREVTLSFLGGTLLLAAFVIGLVAAVNVPAIINLGWPDPHLASELRRLFGYAGWPQLVLKIFWASSTLLIAIGALFVLIARRKQGAGHVLRAVFGAIAMFSALQFLGDALRHENWPMLLDMFDQHRIGPAIELFIDTVRSNDAVAAGAMFVAALVLFAWPARRYPADVTGGGQGVSS